MTSPVRDVLVTNNTSAITVKAAITTIQISCFARFPYIQSVPAVIACRAHPWRFRLHQAGIASRKRMTRTPLPCVLHVRLDAQVRTPRDGAPTSATKRWWRQLIFGRPRTVTVQVGGRWVVVGCVGQTWVGLRVTIFPSSKRGPRRRKREGKRRQKKDR